MYWDFLRESTYRYKEKRNCYLGLDRTGGGCSSYAESATGVCSCLSRGIKVRGRCQKREQTSEIKIQFDFGSGGRDITFIPFVATTAHL